MAKKYVHLSPKTNKMEDCEGPDRCRWRNQNVPHAEAGDTDRIVSIMANAHSNGDMFGTASTNNKDKDSEALARVKKIRKDRGVSTPTEGHLAEGLDRNGDFKVSFPPTSIGSQFSIDTFEGETQYTVTGPKGYDQIVAEDSTGEKRIFNRSDYGPYVITSVLNTVAAHNEAIQGARGYRLRQAKSPRDSQRTYMKKAIRDASFDEGGAAHGGLNANSIKYDPNTDTMIMHVSRDDYPRRAAAVVTVDRAGDAVIKNAIDGTLESVLKKKGVRQEMRRMYERERDVAVAQNRYDRLPYVRMTNYPAHIDEFIDSDVESFRREKENRLNIAKARVQDVLTDEDSMSTFKIGKDDKGIFVVKTDKATGDTASGYIRVGEEGRFNGLEEYNKEHKATKKLLASSLSRVAPADLKELADSYNAPDVTKEDLERYYPPKKTSKK